jgi:hypothetical protein
VAVSCVVDSRYLLSIPFLGVDSVVMMLAMLKNWTAIYEALFSVLGNFLHISSFFRGNFKPDQ